MRKWADFTVQEAGGRTTLVLQGPLLVSTIGVIDRKLREITEPVQFVDISNTGEIDTVGAWTVTRFADEHRARITGGSEQARKLIETVRENASTAPLEAERGPYHQRALGDTGEKVVGFGQGSLQMIGFLGEILVASGSLILHPRRFRMKSLVRQFEL